MGSTPTAPIPETPTNSSEFGRPGKTPVIRPRPLKTARIVGSLAHNWRTRVTILHPIRFARCATRGPRPPSSAGGSSIRVVTSDDPGRCTLAGLTAVLLVHPRDISLPVTAEAPLRCVGDSEPQGSPSPAQRAWSARSATPVMPRRGLEPRNPYGKRALVTVEDTGIKDGELPD